MKKEKTPATRFAKAIVIATVSSLLGLIPACSKSTPSCDSGKAMEAVIYSAGQVIRKDLSAVAALGGPELSDDEWRTIRSGMVINVENITEKGFDENTGNRTCAGMLTIMRTGKKEITPITYSIETNKDSGELKTTMSGFPKKAEIAPEQKTE